MLTPYEQRKQSLAQFKHLAKQTVDFIYGIFPALNGTFINYQSTPCGDSIQRILDQTANGNEDFALACFQEHLLRISPDEVSKFLAGSIRYQEELTHNDKRDIIKTISHPNTLTILSMAFDHLSTGKDNLTHEIFIQRLMEPYGNKQYQVLPGVGELLAHTSVKNMKTNDLRLPFPAFYIEVPLSAGLEEKVLDIDTNQYRQIPIIGLYVNQGLTHEGIRMMQVCTISIDNGERYRGGWGAYLVDDTKLDEVPVIFQRATGGKSERKTIKDMPEARKVLHWIMNLILYLTSHEAVVESGYESKEYRDLTARLDNAPKGSSKRAKILEQRAKVDPRRRIYVGRGITRATVEEALGLKEGKPLESRCWVTSHWHWYWCGEGKTNKIHKWVHAYQKGPVLGPESNPKRVVSPERVASAIRPQDPS